MDYKEKLEEAKRLYETATADQKYVLESLFPEIRESEDELAWLKKYIEEEAYSLSMDIRDNEDRIKLKNLQKALAWLEKQGEQMPADKVKPKFHEGEWITNGNYTWKIIEVEHLDYILQSQDGNIVDDTISHVDEQFHSFTIEDAKDGDVLACGDKVTDCPFIFHNLTKELNPRSYCGVNTSCCFQYNDENGGHWCDSDEVRPATKEQRDTLMNAMADAGYTFDFDKKEVKKISQRMISAEAKEAMYDKTAWSEEDDVMIYKLLAVVELYYNRDGDDLDKQSCINWLKSLKQRIGG